MPEARPEVTCLKQHFLSEGSGMAVKDVGVPYPLRRTLGFYPDRKEYKYVKSNGFRRSRFKSTSEQAGCYQ